MWAAFYGRELQAIFTDKSVAEEWFARELSAYPADSAYDDERAMWRLREVRPEYNSFGVHVRF